MTQQPINGIAATMFHGEGAIAQCGHCKRYTLDRKALADSRQPVCDCGKQHYWSGSFKPPGPDAQWFGPRPAAAPVEQAAPSKPMRADYVKAARVIALGYGRGDDAPAYLPRTEEAAATFEPHAWVIAAMMQAYSDGAADGHAEGRAFQAAQQAAQPVAADTLIALVKEYGRASDKMGRSRQSNNYAMDMGAVVKVCGMEDQIEQQIRALYTAAPSPVALTDEQIEAGAQNLAALFDYPWEHMPDRGRDSMRANVRKVLAAVGIQAGKDGAK